MTLHPEYELIALLEGQRLAYGARDGHLAFRAEPCRNVHPFLLTLDDE